MKHTWVCWLILALGCSQATAPTGGTKPTSASSSQRAIAAAPALTIGSPAPELKVSRFLKGEPVTAFDPGKIYVVEFWATWCGPCVASMPHISELQKRHPEVTFIGVNVLEDNEDAAENFLKSQGDKIGYRIARDVIPNGATARDGIMAQTWLAAAESNGIPEAFVVDGQGRIAQITHPMELDASLPQIIAGTWDIAAAAKLRLQALQVDRQSNVFQETLGQLLATGPTDETLARLEKLGEEFPSQKMLICFTKFRLLVSSPEHSEQALAEGRKLLAGEEGQNPMLLNVIAWNLVDPDREQPVSASLREFAVEIARQADEKSERKEAAIADTLARALFVSGDAKGAVKVQRRAVDLAESDSRLRGDVAELRQRLLEYEAAAAKTNDLDKAP